jgi:FkbM family methyltransferase
MGHRVNGTNCERAALKYGSQLPYSASQRSWPKIQVFSIAGEMKCHYLALGLRGVFLNARALLMPKHNLTSVRVPGLKHPIYLRLRTSDIPSFTQVILGAQYDCDLPRSPNVIVDAGANIGLASVFFANKYPRAKLISVEPVGENLSLLRKNMAGYENSSIVGAAIWSHDGSVGVTNESNDAWGFQTIEGSLEPNIPAMTMSTLMELCGIDYIDLLKIDVEGAEKEIFDNASEWIGRVGAIAIELHDQLQNGCSRNFYMATADFKHEWHRGETTFLSRAA